MTHPSLLEQWDIDVPHTAPPEKVYVGRRLAASGTWVTVVDGRDERPLPTSGDVDWGYHFEEIALGVHGLRPEVGHRHSYALRLHRTGKVAVLSIRRQEEHVQRHPQRLSESQLDGDVVAETARDVDEDPLALVRRHGVHDELVAHVGPVVDVFEAELGQHRDGLSFVLPYELAKVDALGNPSLLPEFRPASPGEPLRGEVVRLVHAVVRVLALVPPRHDGPSSEYCCGSVGLYVRGETAKAAVRLAAAILSDHLEVVAPRRLSQAYAVEVVSRLRHDGWSIGSSDIAAWLSTRLTGGRP